MLLYFEIFGWMSGGASGSKSTIPTESKAFADLHGPPAIRNKPRQWLLECTCVHTHAMHYVMNNVCFM